MNTLELKSVSVPGRLEAASVCFAPGRLVGLVGPNGSGKSTLLQAAGGLLPCNGNIFWEGTPLEKIVVMERARRAAWVPQEATFEFGFSVRSVVAQGRYAYGDDGAGVEEALQQFDLVGLAERPVNRLSGGEKHRVLLARALVTGAKVQLWDEPLAALDPKHGLEVLKLAKGLTLCGATVVFSLHDLRVAHCLDEVVVMQERRVRAAGKPEEVLTPELLRDVFGVQARLGEGLILELPRTRE